MAMLRPATEMKNSGVREIDSIPKEWNCVRIARIIENSAEGIMVGPFGSSLTGAVVGEADGEYKVYGQANLIRRDFDYGDKFVDENKYKELIRYKVIPGDIAISMMGTVGKCRVIPEGIRDGIMDSHLIKARLSSHMLPKYFEYIYESTAVFEQIMAKSNGTIMNGLNSSIVKSLYVVLPPIFEQQAIADYLDDRCSKIDEIISEATASIEEYKELKQAVIFETVTKGLDKKPSNNISLDWCETGICNDWGVSQIRYLYKLRNEKNEKPLEEVNLISLYTDKGVVQHADLEKTTGNKAVTADGYKLVYPEDIVVNIILCWMGAMGRCEYEGVTSPAYDIYEPIDMNCVCSRYYHYLFRTERFAGKCYTLGRGIMMMRWRTYSSEFRAIKVPVPPIDEQVAIADYLDKRIGEMDALISEKQALVEDLQAYKKSLIYEAVTGKRRIV